MNNIRINNNLTINHCLLTRKAPVIATDARLLTILFQYSKMHNLTKKKQDHTK